MGKCKTYYSYARFKSQWETSVHGGASRDLDGYHVLNPKGNIHHHILLDHQKVSKSQREYSSPDRHGRKVGVVYWFQIPTGNFSTTFLCLATSKIIQFQIPMGKSKLYYYAKFSRWTTEFQIPMGSPKLVCFLKRQS